MSELIVAIDPVTLSDNARSRYTRNHHAVGTRSEDPELFQAYRIFPHGSAGKKAAQELAKKSGGKHEYVYIKDGEEYGNERVRPSVVIHGQTDGYHTVPQPIYNQKAAADIKVGEHIWELGQEHFVYNVREIGSGGMKILTPTTALRTTYERGELLLSRE